MRQLEKETMKAMENHLLYGVSTSEMDFLVNLFTGSVQKEVSVYSTN